MCVYRRLPMLVLVAACASPSIVSPPPDNVVPTTCPARVAVADLLARHARSFGAPAAVSDALPLSITSDVELDGNKGRLELVLGRDGHRASLALGPVRIAEGMDTIGPWSAGVTGVSMRLETNEARSVLLDAWVARRGYANHDAYAATCRAVQGRPVADLQAWLPELGDVGLSFDLTTAALVEVRYVEPDGGPRSIRVEAWTARDERGVRWPARSVQTGGAQTTRVTHVATRAGASCDPQTCFAPPATRVGITWPASGRVRVPMEFALSSVLLRARVDGREVRALLDSGAGLTAIDSTSSMAASFSPALEVTGSSATQSVRLGLGSLGRVTLGELVLSDLPSASVPIPALAGYGDRRPELILGFSLFQAAAVRIDYRAGELVFARDGDGLASPAATALPIRILSNKVIIDVHVEGAPAAMQIDTGNVGSFDFYRAWVRASGRFEERPMIEQRGLFSAGTEETVRRLFRLRHARLGPIELERALVSLDDPPATGTLAGLIGNAALARCAAVVFDVAHRKIHFEPPCDREVAVNRFGARLVHRVDTAFPDRPWVIEGILPGGSAHQAGLQNGDRLLEVGGKSATPDLVRIDAVSSQPLGTQVQLVIDRGGQRRPLTMRLVDPAGLE